ncbi:MAG: hypothetical protein ABIF40_02355 [archaeon]
MKQITPKLFEKNCKKFYRIEQKARYYDLAMEIVDEHPLQACIIILATWNSRCFNTAKNKAKILSKLELALKTTEPLFKQLKNKKFATADFSKIKRQIKRIYSSFSKIKGIEYTGASKVMHLLNPELFVMWDNAIRNKSQVSEKNRKRHTHFKNTADGYLEFLDYMQKRYNGIKKGVKGRTLAKCIDENNYIIYSKKK